MALSDRIVAVESGGNATAKNPRSSATGAGQFIDGTWLDMVKRYRPDLAGGSREQVLALRNDPALSKEMVQHYADENGQKLQAAGLPATDGTKYLAHFAGPQGAVNVLSADRAAPVATVLPAASISANPFLRGWSAGQLADWADRKVGGTAPTMQMPGASPAAGRFGLAGVETGPAPAASPAPPQPEDKGPDIAAILKTLGSVGGEIPAAAQVAAAPPPAPPQRQAPVFDLDAYLARLGRRSA